MADYRGVDEMSLDKWPQACPRCRSKDFEEIARVEAGPDTQPHDVAIYRCEDCSLEFCTDDVPAIAEVPRG